MPRGIRVSPAERREWLDQFEQGMSVSDIAKQSKRALSAVRTHISTARQERDQNEAKAHVTRGAYQEHYSDLLGVAGELANRSAAWSSGPVWLPDDTRSRLLVRALEDHVLGSPLWELWREIDTLSRELAKTDTEIKDQLAQLAGQDLPEINVDGVAASIKTALTLAPDLLLEADTWYQFEEEGEGIALVWGAHRLAAGVAGEARAHEISQWHSSLWRQPRASPGELTGLVERYDRLLARGESVVREIDEEVEGLRLRRVLPGRCSFCPDVPIGRSTRHRRNRTQKSAQED